MKICIVALLCSFGVYAQYNSEMVTEKNYEHSQIFFRSHYLNPYGLYGFKDVTAGIIADPFLAISVNPAFLPRKDSGDVYFYVDFRGDRTEVVQQYDYILPAYYDRALLFAPTPMPDYRLIKTARVESEPVLSLGFIAHPFNQFAKGSYLAGTYQVINNKDKYYTMPFWIYSPNLYLDAFGQSLEIRSSLPVTERESGQDELSNEAHLVSLSAGFALSAKLSAGIYYNGVFHTREGGYGRRYDNNHTAGSNPWKNYHSDFSEKHQEYSHSDLSIGIRYTLREGTYFGMKAGMLRGNSEQSFDKNSTYFYQQNTPDVDTMWSFSSAYSRQHQEWTRKGNVAYAGANFSHVLDERKEVSGFYRFHYGKQDLSNASEIIDTSIYSSRYVYSYNQIWQWYKYKSSSVVFDKRAGTGDSREYRHETMLSCRWGLTPQTEVLFGIALNTSRNVIRSSEPVTAARKSTNQSSSYQPTYDYNNVNSLSEDKTLEWEYISEDWALNIPFFIKHKFNSVFSLFVGVNRKLGGTEITDETLAIIRQRASIENGTTRLQTNFGELYKNPRITYSENTTDIITGLFVDLSPEFGVKLLCDPEITPEWRVAQWWMSFSLRL